jgi:RES domain-containing protein
VHAAAAFTGEGAALFPGRYNVAGVRAVYLADCPAGAALEIIAAYAAPEAISTHVLFEVEIDAPLVDLRQAETRRRYGVGLEALVASNDTRRCREVGARLLAERRPGAIVPAATVARAFNVVVYPEVWAGFVVRDRTPLALDERLVRSSAGLRTGA